MPSPHSSPKYILLSATIKPSETHILTFKTNIEDSEMVNHIKVHLNYHPFVYDWSVDTEDIDNVLRIETSKVTSAEDLSKFVTQCGYHCKPLT